MYNYNFVIQISYYNSFLFEVILYYYFMNINFMID